MAAWESAPIHQLTWLGRWVDGLVKGKDQHVAISKFEFTFLKNNPDAIVLIQNSACRSLAVSYALCGVNPETEGFQRTWEEEADAIRHFLFSSYLTCDRGLRFAEHYTVAHEGPPEEWDLSNQMDIYNNYRGFEWASQPGRCQLPMTEERMAKAALKMLAGDQLMTLRKGDTRCRNPQDFNSEDWSTFTERVNAQHLSLQKFYPPCQPVKIPSKK
jgi:hypothetical protein